MRRSQSRWKAIAFAMFCLGFAFLPGVRAQVTEPPPAEEPQSPFQLHPADPGAVTYDDAVPAAEMATPVAGGGGMTEEQYRAASAETKEAFDCPARHDLSV